ncbi:Aste57867_2293 [Aphanomyces stellatus]|uniref:Aste57867_2293 protein n=1 Tax=Aphanomyces stellatus TaxID=120398 RepID=A0A485K9T9_9STRA|nr:hypothetical protein As57867_002288 [Aphanomyces stellatus]VFT79496.1 Aste57867_2293 [Aphanomyces stellatus]
MEALPWPVVLGVVVVNVILDNVAGDVLRDPATKKVKFTIAALSALNAAIAGGVATYIENPDLQQYMFIGMGIIGGPAINYAVEFFTTIVEPSPEEPKKDEAKKKD